MMKFKARREEHVKFKIGMRSQRFQEDWDIKKRKLALPTSPQERLR